MGPDETFTLNCAFCGAVNNFTKDELYEKIVDGKEVYREKFCLECGENVTFTCPVCQKGYPLEKNLRENNPFKILNSFWDPKHTLVDDFLPVFSDKLTDYQTLAEKLNSDYLRASQMEFLKKIPELQEKLGSFEKTFLLPLEPEILRHFDNDFKDIKKNIKKMAEELTEIIKDIDPQSKLLTEKREKALKKHIPFLELIDPAKVILGKVQTLRKEQIQREKDALKPGFEKIKDHIQYNADFFHSVCPICAAQIYGFNHQIYTLDVQTGQLKFFKKMVAASGETKKPVGGSLRVQFDIMIQIQTDIKKELHGKATIILPENGVETFGRDFIRQADFQEADSDKYLHSEDDPLKYVSNSQITLINKNGTLMIKGKEYDPDRPGDYLNSMSNDIRQSAPDGITITSKDKIIIPLIIEPNNPNIIEIKFQY